MNSLKQCLSEFGFGRMVFLTALLALFLGGCGGGGGNTTPPASPSAPIGVNATPGNAQATLSWPAVAGATSYNVYSSASSPVTTAGTKTNVSTPGATLSALTNGTPIFAAVTAMNANGESALSSGVCAVPTAANTTGLTLYDGLCSGTLDGKKWLTPLSSRGVASGAMELSAQIANAESRTVQFTPYQTLVSVNTASRVTTLSANINVPAVTASRTGTAELRAVVRLIYQPPANRLQFPGGNLNQLTMEVGLMDDGGGLRAVRNFRHCDNASCTSHSTTGISFSDPAGFTNNPTKIGQTEAAAAYDTTYTVSVSLNEATGMLTWSFNGGAFSGAMGIADPVVYLANNANWTALGANPLSTGGGFLSGQVGARVFDDSSAGGSAGKVTGRFSNIQVGLNNAVASLFDDFSGTGLNSGPTELRLDKWVGGGRNSMAMNAGSITGQIQATSPNANGFSIAQALSFNNPAAINTMQVEGNVSTCANSVGGTGSSNRVQLQGNFYNDGFAGANVAPDINQPNSPVGDVRAFLFVECATGQATFSILHGNQQNSFLQLSSTVNNVVTNIPGPVTGTHTLTMKWDPTTHAFTFQVDGTGITVDPTTVNARMTTAAPFVKAANFPQKQLGWLIAVPSAAPAGSTASLDFKANNVFTGP